MEPNEISTDSSKTAYLFDRIWSRVFWLSAISLCVISLLYILFGTSLLTHFFNERNVGIVNRFIKNNDLFSADELISVFNMLFIRLLTIASFGLVYTALFVRLFFSSRDFKLIYLIIMFLAPLILLYIINPNERILSNHGLYRSSIVYQILNGRIPPPDPFFSGHQNISPWGYPWLAAQICKLFNISPSFSFAVINIISLVLCIILIYLVARLLVKKTRCINFCIFFSLLGTTVITTPLARWLGGFDFLSGIIEYRALPAIKKFYTINGVPAGLVFYILCIYLSIRLYTSKKKLPTVVFLFLSGLSCCFLYAPFFPGLAGSFFTVVLIMAIFSFISKSKGHIKSSAYLFITAAALSAIVLPYMQSVSSAAGSTLHILNLKYSLQNFANAAVFLSPLLCIILLSWKNHIRPYIESEKWLIFSCFIFAPLIEYISIHLFDSIEYKFLLLSGLGFGIAGGIALCSISMHKHKILVFMTALFFTLPFHERLFHSYTRNNRPITCHKKSPIFSESGINLNFRDSDRQSVYTWLRNHTDEDSTVIESTIYATVLAQRSLYIFPDIPENHSVRGIAMSPETIRMRNGQDIDIYNFRQDVVKSIYGYSKRYSLEEIKDILMKEGKVFILIHNNPDLCEKLKSADFIGVFKSESGKYQVFRPG